MMMPRNDFDDLSDYFMIPINISAGSSMTRNFTGRYNYVQLKLTIEVICSIAINFYSAETASSSSDQAPVAAIAGGVAGGVVVSLIVAVILVLVLALLIFKQKRTKTFDIQGTELIV